MLSRLALVASFLLAASCSVETSQESFGYLHVEGGGVTIETAGVRIEVDGSAVFEQSSHSRTDGPSSSSMTLDGHPFGVREGTFFVGESTFGAVRQSSIVRVKDRAVTVDDETRGTLPAPVTAKSSG
jgi:hypothetical protein